MADSILDLKDVQATQLFGPHSTARLTFNLAGGDLALVDARDLTLAEGLADLCCGLIAPDGGRIRFLARDWSTQKREEADALRGRIGRVLAQPAWLAFQDMTANILLGQAYHTRRGYTALLAEADALSRQFGLPGVPAGPVSQLASEDLTRAGFVRAFMGSPSLVILESPIRGTYSALIPALLNRLAALRDAGGAALWLTRSRLVWDNRSFPATQRWRLDHAGLAAVG